LLLALLAARWASAGTAGGPRRRAPQIRTLHPRSPFPLRGSGQTGKLSRPLVKAFDETNRSTTPR
jgi:hypothetical protein